MKFQPFLPIVCNPENAYHSSTGATNDLLELETDVSTKTVQCRFLHGFTGTAECQIKYSTQADLSGSVVDTGSSTSGDTVTVTLTARLQRDTTYYYLVTATAEGVSVRVEDVFKTGQLQGKFLIKELYNNDTVTS